MSVLEVPDELRLRNDTSRRSRPLVHSNLRGMAVLKQAWGKGTPRPETEEADRYSYTDKEAQDQGAHMEHSVLLEGCICLRVPLKPDMGGA